MDKYGIIFETLFGIKFQLDDINPYVYITTVTFSGAGHHSRTLKYPELDGLMEISAIFVEGYTGANPVNVGINAFRLNIGVSAPSSSPAQVTVSARPASSAGTARYVFDIYARGVNV